MVVPRLASILFGVAPRAKAEEFIEPALARGVEVGPLRGAKHHAVHPGLAISYQSTQDVPR